MDIFGKTCPMCKKAKMKPAGEIRPIKSIGPKGGRRYYGEKRVLRCPNCGHRMIQG